MVASREWPPVGVLTMRHGSALVAGVGARMLKLSACVGMAALLAGCSSDATRLSESFNHPFSNPFAANDAPASVASAAPIAKVTGGPVSAVAAAAPSVAQVAGAQPIQPVTGFKGNWSVAGGSPVVVGTNDSVSTLSQRFGVPSAAILSANGYDSASQVKPGARIVIPVFNGAGGSAVAAKPANAEPANAEPQVADAADPAPVKAKKHKAEPVVADASPDAPAKVKHAKKSPVGTAVADAAPAMAPAALATPLAVAAPLAKKPANPQVAQVPAPQPSVVAMAPAKLDPKKKPAADVGTDPQPTASLTPQGATAVASGDSASGNPEFRWPARGRIIQGFKSGGNDGINISVPDGTSVRAAESGTVAYAGSDLKGYGNLVLIRHPNGFVTAYANNSEISVKRGQTVKRGDIIAKSGESGNVNAPQLHFELRKNSQPVDPTDYLAGL